MAEIIDFSFYLKFGAIVFIRARTNFQIIPKNADKNIAFREQFV